ncbi:MAG: sigma-70 family RNA polymerase sigma factor [Planctomycetes bacterium]|nr:sigma-70 family RNA polymerase sigma factor [Planctomycetota bacterium]MBL7039823.1 sigma-70 family RNA polymerase sigma factor [Pirellulaceae bacterium]
MSNQQMEAQELFRREWVRWQPAIYAYIRTVVFHRSDAEDVLQDVAEILWRKIDEFQEGTRFDQWAYRVARNVMLNYQRKNARRRLAFSEHMTQQLGDEAADAVAEAHAELEALELCIGKLPEPQRELIQRRYAPGATNRSVAAATGRSESAISRALSRIHRGLMRCICLALGDSVPPEAVQ